MGESSVDSKAVANVRRFFEKIRQLEQEAGDLQKRLRLVVDEQDTEEGRKKKKRSTDFETHEAILRL